MTTSTKVNSFTILKTKNQFILLCWKKKLWRMCTNFCINPHNGKLPSRLAPAQCQNSLAPQLLSNNYWSKTKTSISLIESIDMTLCVISFLVSKYLDNYCRYQYCANDTLFWNIYCILRSIFQDFCQKKRCRLLRDNRHCAFLTDSKIFGNQCAYRCLKWSY